MTIISISPDPLPKNRKDLGKGDLSNFISDFEVSVLGQLQNNDPDGLDEGFLFSYEDAYAYDEFKDYLTAAEMRAAFKRAARKA